MYLIVGNTRLHWAWVDARRYLHWNTDHSTPADDGDGVAKVNGYRRMGGWLCLDIP